MNGPTEIVAVTDNVENNVESTNNVSPLSPDSDPNYIFDGVPQLRDRIAFTSALAISKGFELVFDSAGEPKIRGGDDSIPDYLRERTPELTDDSGSSLLDPDREPSQPPTPPEIHLVNNNDNTITASIEGPPQPSIPTVNPNNADMVSQDTVAVLTGLNDVQADIHTVNETQQADFEALDGDIVAIQNDLDDIRGDIATSHALIMEKLDDGDIVAIQNDLDDIRGDIATSHALIMEKLSSFDRIVAWPGFGNAITGGGYDDHGDGHQFALHQEQSARGSHFLDDGAGIGNNNGGRGHRQHFGAINAAQQFARPQAVNGHGTHRGGNGTGNRLISDADFDSANIYTNGKGARAVINDPLTAPATPVAANNKQGRSTRSASAHPASSGAASKLKKAILAAAREKAKTPNGVKKIKVSTPTVAKATKATTPAAVNKKGKTTPRRESNAAICAGQKVLKGELTGEKCGNPAMNGTSFCRWHQGPPNGGGIADNAAGPSGQNAGVNDVVGGVAAGGNDAAVGIDGISGSGDAAGGDAAVGNGDAAMGAVQADDGGNAANGEPAASGAGVIEDAIINA